MYLPQISVEVELSYNEKPSPTDVNVDGVVNILDLVIVADTLSKEDHNLRADANRDGVVDILDLVLVSQHLGDKKQ